MPTDEDIAAMVEAEKECDRLSEAGNILIDTIGRYLNQDEIGMTELAEATTAFKVVIATTEMGNERKPNA